MSNRSTAIPGPIIGITVFFRDLVMENPTKDSSATMGDYLLAGWTMMVSCDLLPLSCFPPVSVLSTEVISIVFDPISQCRLRDALSATYSLPLCLPFAFLISFQTPLMWDKRRTGEIYCVNCKMLCIRTEDNGEISVPKASSKPKEGGQEAPDDMSLEEKDDDELVALDEEVEQRQQSPPGFLILLVCLPYLAENFKSPPPQSNNFQNFSPASPHLTPSSHSSPHSSSFSLGTSGNASDFPLSSSPSPSSPPDQNSSNAPISTGLTSPHLRVAAQAIIQLEGTLQGVGLRISKYLLLALSFLLQC